MFVLKIDGIFEKEKSSPKVLKGVIFFIYSIDKDWREGVIIFVFKKKGIWNYPVSYSFF